MFKKLSLIAVFGVFSSILYSQTPGGSIVFDPSNLTFFQEKNYEKQN